MPCLLQHPGDSQLGNDAVDREDDGILASTEYVVGVVLIIYLSY